MTAQVRLTVVQQFGTMQHSFFESVEAAEKILDDLSAAVAKVNDFGRNEDNAKSFKYKALNSIYFVDLRKVMSASIEEMEKWDIMNDEVAMRGYARYKDFIADADEKGLKEVLERIEKRKER